MIGDTLCVELFVLYSLRFSFKDIVLYALVVQEVIVVDIWSDED